MTCRRTSRRWKSTLSKRLEVESDEAKAGDLAGLLLEQAEIAAGAQLPDPAAFVQRLNRVLLG
jgi:molecular chaperone HtpG